jgi:hypothetical protein
MVSMATLQGCATITRGTTEALVVETEPVGADVEISPVGMKCTTPCTVKLKRKHDYFVDIRKSGYEPVKVNVVSEIAGAGAAGMAGNVLLGGLIGVGIDAATGATKKLTPNPVKVTLLKLAPPAPLPEPTNVTDAQQPVTEPVTPPPAVTPQPAAEPGVQPPATSPATGPVR